MADDPESRSKSRTESQQAAPAAGPGVIAGQGRSPMGGAHGISSGLQPGDTAPTTTHLAGKGAVGTPGGSTGMANPAPGLAGGTGMSGASTNDAAPHGGRTDTAQAGQVPEPDMVKEPPIGAPAPKSG